jgi:hypothetical protein
MGRNRDEMNEKTKTKILKTKTKIVKTKRRNMPPIECWGVAKLQRGFVLKLFHG